MSFFHYLFHIIIGGYLQLTAYLLDSSGYLLDQKEEAKLASFKSGRIRNCEEARSRHMFDAAAGL